MGGPREEAARLKGPVRGGLAVVQPQGVIATALGHLSKDPGAPDADATTIFEIGSTTKVFTAILLGLTVDPSFG